MASMSSNLIILLRTEAMISSEGHNSNICLDVVWTVPFQKSPNVRGMQPRNEKWKLAMKRSAVNVQVDL